MGDEIDLEFERVWQESYKLLGPSSKKSREIAKHFYNAGKGEIIKKLQNDKLYYDSWVNNISICFHDEFKAFMLEKLKWSNESRQTQIEQITQTKMMLDSMSSVAQKAVKRFLKSVIGNGGDFSSSDQLRNLSNRARLN